MAPCRAMACTVARDVPGAADCSAAAKSNVPAFRNRVSRTNTLATAKRGPQEEKTPALVQRLQSWPGGQPGRCRSIHGWCGSQAKQIATPAPTVREEPLGKAAELVTMSVPDETVVPPE